MRIGCNSRRCQAKTFQPVASNPLPLVSKANSLFTPQRPLEAGSTASSSVFFHSAAFACIVDPLVFVRILCPTRPPSFRFKPSYVVLQGPPSQENLVSQVLYALVVYPHSASAVFRESLFLPPSSLFVSPKFYRPPPLCVSIMRIVNTATLQPSRLSAVSTVSRRQQPRLRLDSSLIARTTAQQIPTDKLLPPSSSPCPPLGAPVLTIFQCL